MSLIAVACGDIDVPQHESPVCIVPRRQFVDADGDGYGAGLPVEGTCNALPEPGRSFLDTDCDDTAPTAWRIQTLYTDADRDGVGSNSEPLEGCYASGPGYSPTYGDCDDTDSRVQALSFVDADHDDWGSDEICVPQGEPTVSEGGDCADTDASRNPAAIDLPGDEVDANCDGWGFPIAYDCPDSTVVSHYQCVDAVLPTVINPTCASQPDPLIIAAHPVTLSPLGRTYRVKVANIGGATASVYITVWGERVSSTPLTLAPLAVSDWIDLGTPNTGTAPVAIVNADNSPDCSSVDSTAEFRIRLPARFP